MNKEIYLSQKFVFLKGQSSIVYMNKQICKISDVSLKYIHKYLDFSRSGLVKDMFDHLHSW